MTKAVAEAPSPERPVAVLQNPRPGLAHDSETDTREALELREIQTLEDNRLEESTQSNSSGDEYRVVTRRTTSRAAAARVESRRRRLAKKGAWGKFARFWTHHVTLTVPHKSSRDYFALERTFLAYIRTSLVVTQQGVLIAQLFRLPAAEALADRLGFSHVGIPLSVTCHCVAIFVALLGAYRFWRQQNAIARGKIILTVLIVCIAIVVER
ncbi:hypothetical protein PENANT_c003G06866 [Penicillium antarcticum]|uniref:DUF202 domain-containing protein n=1 Tax=Penicillium antarcticum TaxID=416450 RepID=A0A1V6QIF3_9EURO|nr:hypothetical protein PENANT_c003G06866 [Penicillium antarcticum]